MSFLSLLGMLGKGALAAGAVVGTAEGGRNILERLGLDVTGKGARERKTLARAAQTAAAGNTAANQDLLNEKLLAEMLSPFKGVPTRVDAGLDELVKQLDLGQVLSESENAVANVAQVRAAPSFEEMALRLGY